MSTHCDRNGQGHNYQERYVSELESSRRIVCLYCTRCADTKVIHFATMINATAHEEDQPVV